MTDIGSAIQGGQPPSWLDWNRVDDSSRRFHSVRSRSHIQLNAFERSASVPHVRSLRLSYGTNPAVSQQTF